jgi:adenine-specific DNA-methyltransferase
MTPEPKQMALTTPDIRQERMEHLKRLMPDLFDGEGKLDEHALKALIDPEGNAPHTERFRFEWAGKHQSKQIAFTPSRGALVVDKARSINFDTTENLILEGDNLEVLKLLQTSYFEQVKCIYIDPPYNTQKDFIYPDKFAEGKKAYWMKNGTIKDGVKLTAVTEQSGRKHSNWLNMMQARLLLARQLLRQDGVILISIDDNEQAHLKVLCDDIFGEENFVACLSTIMNLKGNHDNFGFSDTHEYTFVYAKNVTFCRIGMLSIDEEGLNDWLEDDYGLYKEADNLRATGVNAPKEKRPNLWYPIFLDENTQDFYVTENDSPLNSKHTPILPVNPAGEELSWYWGKTKFNSNKHNLILKKTSNGWQFYKKQRPELGDIPTKKPKTVFYKSDYSTSTATTKLRDLMGEKVFDGPKPVPFLHDLMEIGTDSDSIVLDFFAGSGTTAQAVIQANQADAGNRKFILVQVPEYTDETHPSYKAGYKTISDLCMERVKRAGEKLKQEHPESTVDTGFRVYKLTDSHFPENLYTVDDTQTPEEARLALEAHINAPRQASLFEAFEDVVCEIALKNGFGLFYTLETVEAFTANKVYRLTGGGKSCLLCLDDTLAESTLEALTAGYSDTQLVCSSRALDTTTKWTLQSAFNENLWMV